VLCGLGEKILREIPPYVLYLGLHYGAEYRPSGDAELLVASPISPFFIDICAGNDIILFRVLTFFQEVIK